MAIFAFAALIVTAVTAIIWGTTAVASRQSRQERWQSRKPDRIRMVDHGNRGIARLGDHARSPAHVVIALARCGADRHAHRQGEPGADNAGGEIMKTMVRAAITVLSLGTGAAYAGDGDGYSATTLFTALENEQAAPARTVAVRNNGAPVQTPTLPTPTRRARTRGCFAYSRHLRS